MPSCLSDHSFRSSGSKWLTNGTDRQTCCKSISSAWLPLCFLSSFHSNHEYQVSIQALVDNYHHENLLPTYPPPRIIRDYRKPYGWFRYWHLRPSSFQSKCSSPSARSTPSRVRVATPSHSLPQLTRNLRTPLPLSPDGVMPDNSIINYSPSTTPTQNSCWTSPLSRPPPSKPYVGGTCSVCVVQRSDNDGSADYQLWARDSKNNAMGNMDPTTVRPLDGTSSNANAQTQPSIAMGGSPLQLWAMLSSENPAYSVANLRWVVPPHDPSAPLSDTTIPQAMFDPTPGLGGGNNCAPAGTAPNGVVYFACTFAC